MSAGPAAGRRILLSYAFGPAAIPLGAAVAEALERRGHQVLRFHSQPQPWTHRLVARHISGGLSRLIGRDLERHVPGSSAWTRDRQLSRACAEFRPDDLIVLLGNTFSPGLIPALAARHGIARTIGWWVKDTRCSPRERTLSVDFQRFLSMGAWPDAAFPRLDVFASDPARWHPPAAPVVQDIPVLFVGGWNRRRDPFFRALAGLDVHCHGPHWTKQGFAAFHRSDGLWGDDLLRTMHRAQVVINVSSHPTADGGGANLRLLDVPLSGACLLTEHCAALVDVYGDAAPAMAFTTPDDLRARIEALLADPPARMALAATARARAAVHPTYDAVAERLLGG